MIAELVDDIKKYFFKENNFVPIFQNKNFVRLWSIQILSQITANMLNFILMIYVFEKTGSTIAVGVLLAFMPSLPSFWVHLAGPLLIFGIEKRSLFLVVFFRPFLFSLIWASAIKSGPSIQSSFFIHYVMNSLVRQSGQQFLQSSRKKRCRQRIRFLL